MRTPVFSTRLTERLGITHPILGGGLMWLSDARYVSALSHAGCLGFITPRSFPDLAALRTALHDCRERTQGKPFGVNLSLSSRPEANAQVQATLDTALAAGVRHFETAGNAPHALVDTIHAAGGVVIHKATSLRHAIAAQAAGVDAIALIGLDAGGHPGTNELSTMLLGTLARESIQVPLVLGGGIGHGSQLTAALAIGADGVLMGSRFLVCEEIAAHPDYKAHLMDCDEHSTLRVLNTVSRAWRVLHNDTAREVQAVERTAPTDWAPFAPLMDSTVARDVSYGTGDWRQGMLSLGPAIAFAKRIEPLRDIIDAFLREASRAAERLSLLRSTPA